MSINRFSLALNATGNERYVVRKGADMLALLRALAARHAPANLHFGEADDPLHTQLIGINPAFEELVFAPGPDRAALARLLAAGSFGVETSLESIRILFIATHAEATQFKGESAFRARIPDTLSRLQRRESVRVPTPKDKPSYCVLRVDAASADGELRLRVHDVSSGGLGLGLPAAGTPIEPGNTLSDCALDVPGMGTLRCTLSVVYVKDAETAGQEQRIGCRFVDLPALSREQIRGYATRLERAQLAVLASANA